MGNDTVPPVGTKVWHFDDTRNIYPKDARGRNHGSPIWREHWTEKYVCFVNKRSVFVSYTADTDPKQAIRTERVEWLDGKAPSHIARTTEEIDRRAWAEAHRWRIKEILHRASPEALAKIADLLGYVEPEGTEQRPASLKENE